MKNLKDLLSPNCFVKTSRVQTFPSIILNLKRDHLAYHLRSIQKLLSYLKTSQIICKTFLFCPPWLFDACEGIKIRSPYISKVSVKSCTSPTSDPTRVFRISILFFGACNFVSKTNKQKIFCEAELLFKKIIEDGHDQRFKCRNQSLL